MDAAMTRGGVEDTRLEAKAKDTKKSEAKAKDSLSEDRHSRGQGPRTQAQVLSKKQKKRSSQKFFRRSPKKKKKKKRSSQKFFKRSPQKNVFQKIFQALHKLLTIQKILLSSSRGQANFRGLQASRPRTSKCVLEDVLEAKDVLEDSTSGYDIALTAKNLKTKFFFAWVQSHFKLELREFPRNVIVMFRAHYTRFRFSLSGCC